MSNQVKSFLFGLGALVLMYFALQDARQITKPNWDIRHVFQSAPVAEKPQEPKIVQLPAPEPIIQKEVVVKEVINEKVVYKDRVVHKDRVIYKDRPKPREERWEPRTLMDYIWIMFHH